MWYQFILQNLHFGINVLVALSFFAVFWLYLDAYSGKKDRKFIPLISGYLLLSLYYLLKSSVVDFAISDTTFFDSDVFLDLLSATKNLGAFLIIVTLFLDSSPQKPSIKSKALLIVAGVSLPLRMSMDVMFIFLAAFIAFLYLRRSTLGLERHLRAVSYSFFLLSFSSIIGLSIYFRDTSIPQLYDLVVPFGMAYIVEEILLLVGSILLTSWVFNYLFKRFQTQLFMIMNVLILFIFIASSVAFTATLLSNLLSESYSRIKTDVSVLDYVISAKQSELESNTRLLARDESVIEAVIDAKSEIIGKKAEDYLVEKNLTTLIITDKSGVVIARGEEKEKNGESLSENKLIKRALLGEEISSSVLREKITYPEVIIETAIPIVSDDEIIGSILSGISIDTAFVDGIKKSTGLEASVYAGNSLSATTLVSPDSGNRLTGIKEEKADIMDKVIDKGENYSSSVSIANVSYIASYIPIKDSDQAVIGMLFVGRSELSVLEIASKSIKTTYMITVLLMIFGVIPSYYISKYLSSQIK